MKKASVSLSAGTVCVLVLTVIIFIGYLMFIDRFSGVIEHYEEHAICEQSNLNMVQLRMKLGGTNQVLAERQDNRCTTAYLTGKNAVKKEEEFKALASQLAQCWSAYLKGEHQIFDTKDQNTCAFCAVVDFENNEPLPGFIDYLRRTPVPGTSISYAQYLAPVLDTENPERAAESTQVIAITEQLKRVDVIDTSKKYAVIFAEGLDVYPDSEVNLGVGELGVMSAGILGLGQMLGLGLCSTGLGCLAVIGVAAGGSYFLGSTENPDRPAAMLLVPHTREELEKLKCTRLEGRDSLEVVK